MKPTTVRAYLARRSSALSLALLGLGCLAFAQLIAARCVASTKAYRERGRVAAHKAAFLGISLLVYTIFAVTGLAEAASLGLTAALRPSGRLGDFSLASQRLGTAQLAWQSFDTVVCLVLPGWRSPVALVHHATCALIAFVTLRPMLHAFSWYFAGVVEASTVLLSVLDAFRESEPLRDAFPRAHEAARIAFHASFLTVRSLWFVLAPHVASDLLGHARANCVWSDGKALPCSLVDSSAADGSGGARRPPQGSMPEKVVAGMEQEALLALSVLVGFVVLSVIQLAWVLRIGASVAKRLRERAATKRAGRAAAGQPRKTKRE